MMKNRNRLLGISFIMVGFGVGLQSFDPRFRWGRMFEMALFLVGHSLFLVHRSKPAGAECFPGSGQLQEPRGRSVGR